MIGRRFTFGALGPSWIHGVGLSVWANRWPQLGSPRHLLDQVLKEASGLVRQNLSMSEIVCLRVMLGRQPVLV